MGKPSGSTLATWLSDLEVDRLERVLAARPDAASPPEPRSFGELADRLQRPASVAPVLPGLALRWDPPLLGRMTRVLLDLNFPPSLHGELCEAVGLELEEAETGLVSAKRRQRDRRMREMVLKAYEYQCAFCGYDGRIGTVPVGLEAAHVRWWAFDGPGDLEVGLCLCSLHHKLFDKGVLGLGEGRGEAHPILASQSFVGRSTAAREHVITLAGRPVIGPQSGVRPIAGAHRSWHTSQVFQGSPRPATTA